MRRIVILAALLTTILLTGCATFNEAYYTDPNSQGYNEAVLNGLCENCNRDFNFSHAQANYYENISCPYCGHTQNLRMANNRAKYEYERQQEASNAQFIMGIADSFRRANQRAAENEQRIISDYQKSLGEMWKNRPKNYNVYDNTGRPAGTIREQ
ncbi:MAG: hypothetical protein ACYSSI_10325 [Planctomycetota bacterium]|jgi:hypothetical protein